jgi:hypothetical protein
MHFIPQEKPRKQKMLLLTRLLRPYFPLELQRRAIQQEKHLRRMLTLRTTQTLRQLLIGHWKYQRMDQQHRIQQVKLQR